MVSSGIQGSEFRVELQLALRRSVHWQPEDWTKNELQPQRVAELKTAIPYRRGLDSNESPIVCKSALNSPQNPFYQLRRRDAFRPYRVRAANLIGGLFGASRIVEMNGCNRRA